jgi:hypothetical protein
VNNTKPSYIFKIEENTLEIRASYVVSVSVTVGGSSLEAIYTFITESFTYSGNCTIYPASGLRGVTNFAILCSPMKNKALIFEFFDKNSEEVSKEFHSSGRMLGISNKGELWDVIMTRGILVVYIGYGMNYVHQIYNITLTDDIEKADALLNYALQNPLYLENLPSSTVEQQISSLPDIITNKTYRKPLFDMLLQHFIPENIKEIQHVKMQSLLLNNVVSKLGKDNMDFNAARKVSDLTDTMTKILVTSVRDSIQPINPKVIKENVGVLLNVVEMSHANKNQSEVDATQKYITLDTFTSLQKSSEHAERMLNNLQKTLTMFQKPGFPPSTVSAKEKLFTLKAVQEDPEYNVSLLKMLQWHPDIPVKLSPLLMNRLQTELQGKEKLSLSVAIVEKNLFKSFNKVSVSNLLMISLNKHNNENNIFSIRHGNVFKSFFNFHKKASQ